MHSLDECIQSLSPKHMHSSREDYIAYGAPYFPTTTLITVEVSKEYSATYWLNADADLWTVAMGNIWMHVPNSNMKNMKKTCHLKSFNIAKCV